MLFRAIALTLALLIGIGTIIPLGTDYAEAGPRTSKKYKKHKKYKKYSKRWWRQYRARMKRKRALQARRRAMRLRQLRLARRRGDGRRSSKPVVVAKEERVESPSRYCAGRCTSRGSAPLSSSAVSFPRTATAGIDLGLRRRQVKRSTPDASAELLFSDKPATRSYPSQDREHLGINDYHKSIGGRSGLRALPSRRPECPYIRVFLLHRSNGRI